MDDVAGFDGLSRAHALALRLQMLGADHDLIAECLGVGPETVGPLLEIATAKLERRRASLTPAELATNEGATQC